MKRVPTKKANKAKSPAAPANVIVPFPENTKIFSDYGKLEKLDLTPEDAIMNIIIPINNLALAVKAVLLYKDQQQLLPLALNSLVFGYDPSLISCNPALQKVFTISCSEKNINFKKNGINYSYELPKEPYRVTAENQASTYSLALRFYIKNNEMYASEILKVVFREADKLMNSVKGSESYLKVNGQLAGLLKYLSTDFQDSFISSLIHHWNQCFYSLKVIANSYTIANTQLTELQESNKVIALLEPVISVKESGAIQLESEYLGQFVQKIKSTGAKQDTNIGHEKGCRIMLAEAYRNIGRYKDCFLHLFSALENFGLDQKIILSTCHTLIFTMRYDLLSQFINLLDNGDFKKFLQLHFTSEQINIDEINPNNLPEYYKNIFPLIQIQAEFDRKVTEEIDKEYFTQQILALNTEGIISIASIGLALHCRLYELAKSLLTQIPNEVKTSSYLQRLISLIDSTNPELVESISQYDTTNAEKATLHADAASSLLVDDNNKEIALAHVEQGLKFDPENEYLIRTGFFAALLSGNKEKIEKFFRNLSADQKRDIAEDYGVTLEELEDIDLLQRKFNPQSEHEYHRLQKEQRLHEVTKIAAQQLNVNLSWKVNDKVIYSSEVTYVGDYKGIKCYGYIDPKLEVGSEAVDNAQSKGIVTRKHGQNGWKIIPGHGIELKANIDTRYFTNKLLLNKEKCGLVKLDHKGNHDAAASFFNDHVMELINTDSSDVDLAGQIFMEH